MLLGLAAFLALGTLAVAKVEIWRQNSAAAFSKGEKSRITISNLGCVRLSPVVRPRPELAVTRVWDVLEVGGEIYAATGGGGVVYRVKAEGTDPWKPVLETRDSQVLSLAVGADGAIFAGTGPGGRVYRVDRTGSQPETISPSVQYVWDLAADAPGNLYAATGPEGELWKRASDGKWTRLFKGSGAHLLCLALTPDGAVLAGSDGQGIIYRADSKGKVEVLFDAPQTEIRALTVSPTGDIFAGSAHDTAGSSLTDSNAARPAAPGENVVYRIGENGSSRELGRFKGSIHRLLWSPERLLVATGPEAQVYELRERTRESATIARLDHGHVLALAPGAGGRVWMGASDPAAVLALEAEFASDGSLVSEVRDMKLASRIGVVDWEARTPEGTSVTLAVRTGNSSQPDATWSEWQEVSSGREPAWAKASSPARYVQYSATLRTEKGRETPELRSVTVAHQSLNLAPEISKITVPEVGTGTGSARETKLSFKWEATDPNDDALEYRVWLQKEDWPGAVELTPEPLGEPTFTWDSTTMPVGRYRLRVAASDRRGNRPEEALEKELESDFFLVDHEAPKLKLTRRADAVQIEAEDSHTRLVAVDSSLDGGPWIPRFPDDRIFDRNRETVSLQLPSGLRPGTHVLVVRATDAAGNVGASDLILEVER
jgi:outer membrane protein assembly factor BamB